MERPDTAGQVVHNKVAGVVAGPVVQVGTLHGDVNVHHQPPSPRQLPGAIRQFVGRSEQLAILSAALDTGESSQTIAVIEGGAGVGKTALAVHWSRQVEHRFPDGQLYVDLRGFDPSRPVVAIADVVRGFLDAFFIEPRLAPTSVEAQLALYRSLVAGRRMIVVLDNAWDSDQVRPLLPGTPTCFVLVTSRNRLTGLVVTEGARPLQLDVLDVEAARRLMAHYLGRRGDDVDEIIEQCARLPLALAILGARAAANQVRPLSVVAAELRESRLDALDGSDGVVGIRRAFSWSYQRLSEPAAMVFRLLAVQTGPSISLAATASLTALPERHVRKALDELVHSHLASEPEVDRFAFHDLLRRYAHDLLTASGEHRAALHRLLDHYVHSAHGAAKALNPTRDHLELAPPVDGVRPEPLTDRSQALRWTRDEHAVLVATIDLAQREGFHAHAIGLARCTATFLYRQGYWLDWVATQHAALASARHLADRVAEARANRDLGRAYVRLGRPDEAQHHLESALDLLRPMADRIGRARVHHALARVFELRNQHAEALRHATDSLQLFKEADYLPGEANALNNAGWYHAQLGQTEQAAQRCEQALALSRHIGDQHCEAAALHNLGRIRRPADLPKALMYLQEAVALYEQLGERYNCAMALDDLGDGHHAADDVTAARAAWRGAARILATVAPDLEAEVRTKLNG